MKISLYILFIILIGSNNIFAEVLRVIDGDTIVLNGKKIRFSGIDAPELDQVCIKKEKNIFCGLVSKKILIKKIGNQFPKCTNEGIDRYKRVLAECFIKNESLSAFLVKNGYAFAYRKYSKKFIKNEEFAKQNKLGIWSMMFQYPWDYRKLK